MKTGSLRTAVEDFFASFRVGERIKTASLEFMEHLEDEAQGMYDDLLDHYGLTGKLDVPVTQKSGNGKLKRRPVQLFAIIAGTIGLLLSPISAGMSVIGNEIRYILDRERRTFRPDIATLIQLTHLIPGLRDHYEDYMKQLGLRDEDREPLRELLRPRPSAFEMIAAARRGVEPLTDVQVKLTQMGYSSESVEAFFRLSEQIPPVTDLISMAVRDAFNDRAAERFKYDEDFPNTILEHTRKQGLPDDWVRRYWRAHWNLPSPQQAFEMFRRLRPGRSSHPFTEADLRQYLVTADIPAFFRDRFQEIAYNPLTRVDVRRMFGLGVLDERGVYEAYLDDGYSPENARLLTQFTVRFEAGAEKELSRTAITSAYKRGMFTEGEARTELLAILGSDTLVNFYMEMANFELAQDEQDAEIDNLKVRYVEGIIDRPTTVGALGRLNLPATQQNTLLLKWDVLREHKIVIPSKADYENWYKRHIVNQSEAETGLRERGIRDQDIRRHVAEWNAEIQESAQKELERSQKEQERLRASTEATEYQKRVAGKDVEIAEAKLEIANIKAALHDLPEDQDPDELKQRILDIEIEIAQITLEKAEIKRDR